MDNFNIAAGLWSLREILQEWYQALLVALSTKSLPLDCFPNVDVSRFFTEHFLSAKGV